MITRIRRGEKQNGDDMVLTRHLTVTMTVTEVYVKLRLFALVSASVREGPFRQPGRPPAWVSQPIDLGRSDAAAG
jgi:hypothetical protein